MRAPVHTYEQALLLGDEAGVHTYEHLCLTFGRENDGGSMKEALVLSLSTRAPLCARLGNGVRVGGVHSAGPTCTTWEVFTRVNDPSMSR